MTPDDIVTSIHNDLTASHPTLRVSTDSLACPVVTVTDPNPSARGIATIVVDYSPGTREYNVRSEHDDHEGQSMFTTRYSVALDTADNLIERWFPGR